MTVGLSVKQRQTKRARSMKKIDNGTVKKKGEGKIKKRTSVFY